MPINHKKPAGVYDLAQIKLILAEGAMASIRQGWPSIEAPADVRRTYFGDSQWRRYKNTTMAVTMSAMPPKTM